MRFIHTFYGLETFYVKVKTPTILDGEPQGSGEAYEDSTSRGG